MLPVIWFALACSGDPSGAQALPAPEPTSCPGDEGGPTEMLVAPIVQLVEPTSAWIVWESAEGEGSRVDFGEGEVLSRTSCGDLVSVLEGAPAGPDVTQVHEVLLGDLTPGTTYRYQARTGELTSAVATFKTPLPREVEAPVRLVALGDSQRDDNNKDKLQEIITDGVLPWSSAQWDERLTEAVDLALLAGDLVDNGWSPADWTDELFAPAAPLFSSIPLYPVLGNHEGNSPLYFRYFHLPDDNGERYYSFDRSNLRIIALDSNPPYDDATQLAWLDGVLEETCGDEAVDFVLAELHHPHKSELWPDGESPFSGEVVARLESFSTRCGKPSVHLYGHTHAYSRGQSRDHNHLWVNVSSAGGALDRFGGDGPVDYPEFVRSESAWGFVAIESTAGDAPTLRLRRVSRGDESVLDNVVTDDLTLSLDNLPPQAPTTDASQPGCDLRLVAGPFVDPDGSTHQATHWQVAERCEDLGTPLAERWLQSENVWDGVDLQQGDDLTDETFPELKGLAAACFRARYRDGALAWSDWSAPREVVLSSCP